MERPEIYNRFGKNFIVFDFIREKIASQILDTLIAAFLEAHEKRNGLELSLGYDARQRLGEWAIKDDVLEMGGRGIRTLIDTALVKPVHRTLFDDAIEQGAYEITELWKEEDDQGEVYHAKIEERG